MLAQLIIWRHVSAKVNWPFVPMLNQTDNKDVIQALDYRPFVWETTGDTSIH